jgi:hypothetical protein
VYVPSAELGLPQPLTHERVCSGKRAHFAGKRGRESLNSDEGTYTVVLLIFTYFVVGKQFK